MIVNKIREIYESHNLSAKLDQYQGISEKEIRQVEQDLNVILPAIYKEMLKEFGPRVLHDMCPTLGPSEFNELQQDAKEIFAENAAPDNQLPDGAFIFICGEDDFCFFVADGSSDDPRVYGYYDEDDNYHPTSHHLEDWYLHHAYLRVKYGINQ